jgi:hypothetical protein
LLSDSPTSGVGTYDINFLNHGGQQADLGHLLLAGGNASEARISASAEPGFKSWDWSRSRAWLHKRESAD